MKIPFLNFLKRKSATPASAPAAAPAPVEKPSSERLSKTVLPNATRTVPAHDPLTAAASLAPVAAAEPAAPRVVSFGSSAPEPRIPPAVAVALEPRVERVISLDLSDVIPQMPQGWTRPVSDAEASRRVLLKAAEVERGMSNGRPTVSLSSIYHQVPEIFVRPVPESEATQVALPFTKVLQEFTNLHTRADQVRDQVVPQVETPFLRVTMEDNSRFGTPMGPVATCDAPPVNVQPATAEAFAAAEPEPVLRERVQPTPIRLHTNGNGVTAAPPNEQPTASAAPVVSPEPPATAAASAPPPAAPTRIPFKLSPTGPDAPASERVPASSGPSGSTTAPTAPVAPSPSVAPTRIPFKLSPAPEPAAPPKAHTWLTKEDMATDVASTEELPPNEKQPAAPESAGLTISLPLKPVLRALPPFQLTGDISGVPDDARFEVPFAAVEPQLASGRIVLPPDDFAAALPAEHKGLFSSKEIAAPVTLPLQDVLKNLPATSLRMRQDQVEQEKGVEIETPFSTTAKEDAKRFNLAAAPAAPKPAAESESGARPSVVASLPAKNDALTEQRAPEPVVSAPEKPAPLPVSLKVEPEPEPATAPTPEVDAKSVLAELEKLPAVSGCAFLFEDGLSLAGALPESFEADGLCAMAPSLMQRIENHLVDTKRGTLGSMTLSCADAG
ncbi:MAG TPA: hypothetical protein VG095_10770, partial [Chthoniobacterales bacterium]|nr:hypothetical protein [Chthoniobacterales bacterium]